MIGLGLIRLNPDIPARNLMGLRLYQSKECNDLITYPEMQVCRFWLYSSSIFFASLFFYREQTIPFQVHDENNQTLVENKPGTAQVGAISKAQK